MIKWSSRILARCGAVRSGAGAISHTRQLYAYELLSIACMRIFTLEIAHFSNVHVHIHIYPILMFAFTFTFVFKYVLCVLFCFVTYSPFVWMFFDHIRSFAVAVAAFFSFIYFAKFHIFACTRLRSQKVEIQNGANDDGKSNIVWEIGLKIC